ncbi:MAG TPA: transglutaminase-like domain-containing protein [Bryobacteraceae bacterium]|nr:transglutaminase-like domain-containing protein [Bryobacteraceae bacterium]
MKDLAAFLSGKLPDIDLDRAALEMAAIEFPSLDPEPSLATLEAIAAELRERLRGAAGGLERVSIANDFLFEHLGFRGNQADYYNPHNSCLNQVLERRSGIPITLSLVYIEVARRVGMPVQGIGLPGHFIVHYDDGRFAAFIDPFHGGRLLTSEDCEALVRERLGADAPVDPSMLAPAGKKQILVRMLYNLRAIYIRNQAFGQALEVLNLLIVANPMSAQERKQRGLVHLHLRKLTAGRVDFEEYLRLSPEASDREEIRQQLETIHRWLGTLN